MTADIKNIKALQDSVKQVTQSNLLKPEMLKEFNSVFKEAAAAMSNVNTNEWSIKEKKKKENVNEISLDKVDRASLAQLNQGVAQNAMVADPAKLNIVPLQVFLDNAILALDKVSKQEFRVNNLMDQFVEGKISEDEVVLETAKLNLSISMVTTIVQSAVQTFKEIQNIPV